MSKFNFNESPVVKAAEEIREPEQGRVEQQPQETPPAAEPMVLKNVGAKIPYSIYDRLERIKRQSERSGNRADKRNIGDLIAQAIKEFVEKHDRPTPTLSA